MTEPAKHVVTEAQRGRSERTPFLALSGVTLIVVAVVALVMLGALLAYYFG
jgi:uncharacterized membrane protein YhaH (DUF805 family)